MMMMVMMLIRMKHTYTLTHFILCEFKPSLKDTRV
jgi:hypothetical protein